MTSSGKTNGYGMKYSHFTFCIFKDFLKLCIKQKKNSGAFGMFLVIA